MPLEEVRRQARLLARENRRAEPAIERIYWFPDEQEVRLIELMPSIPSSGGVRIQPFYFRPSPTDNLPAPSGIAIIRPEEFRVLQTPTDWGDWDRAQLIDLEELE